MDKAQQIQKKIYEIEDRIRTAPEGTPHKTVFEWYREIDRLREEQAALPAQEKEEGCGCK